MTSFLDEMAALLGEADARRLLEALQAPSRKSVNWLPGLAEGTSPIPWCPDTGRWWLADELPGRTLHYTLGHYYIQEASAMLAAEAARLAQPLAGLRVLDLCAAPGGKATQLAAHATGGLLVANEVIRGRVDALRWNLTRHRLPNTVTVSLPTERLAAMLPGWFDVVMVDAPCSGEGLFARRKHRVQDWSRKQVEVCARRQASILSNARALLRPGGLLVYATCTFSREEDEDRTAALLDAGMLPVDFPPLPELSPALSPREDVQRCSRRIWPHVQWAAGAYACLLRAPDGPQPPQPRMATHQSKRWARMLNADEPPLSLPEDTCLWRTGDVLRASTLPQLPQCLAQADVGLPVLHAGKAPQWLHGCARWPSAPRLLPLEEAQARAYARGEDLRLPTSDGWWLPAWQGEALGLAKASRERLANHLPKPLRVMG